MKPFKLAVLCSILAIAGCGDKQEADTAKNATGSMIEQAKEAAGTATDKAGQMASDAADAAKDTAAAAADKAADAADATAQAAADAAGAAADTAAAAGEATADAAADAAQSAQQAAADTAAAAAAAVAPAAGDAAAGGADLALGQSVYEGKCKACHATGAAGSPKLDDKANWAPRIAQGMDTLVKHALEGFKGTVGYMPPKGGFATLTDDEVKAAVAYMVSQAK